MKDVTVEVIKPFSHTYPVTDSLGDFVEERMVPGKDGFPVKRPVAFKRIEGLVDYVRPKQDGTPELVTKGTGLITIPKEQADILIARGLVRAVGTAPGAADDQEAYIAPPPATARRGRPRPEPVPVD
jgi:hypothetical protein